MPETPLLHFMIGLKPLIISKDARQNPQNSAIFVKDMVWSALDITGEIPP